MKKILLLIAICFISVFVNAQGYQYTPVDINNIYPNYQPAPVQQEVQWYVAIGQTADGSKRIKVKYQLDMFNNVCTMCGAYVWTGSDWMEVFIGKDNLGYYVSYYDKYYF